MPNKDVRTIAYTLVIEGVVGVPEGMSREELEERLMRADVSFDSPLVDYHPDGYDVTYLDWPENGG